MELLYSQSRRPAGGQQFHNPRLFEGPVEGATKVVIDGDWPDVEKAYRALGVPVEVIGRRSPPKRPNAMTPPDGLADRLEGRGALDHAGDGKAGGHVDAARDGITKDQIIAELTERGIEHDPRALKADLLSLLEDAKAQA